MNFLKINILIISFILSPMVIFASEDQVDINQVVSHCNTNGTCESYETSTSCSADCAVADTTSPVITLTGSSSVTVNQGATYNDNGATATDDVDGDITSNITTVNPVNTSIPATYTVTYNVSDAADNPATQVTRTVTVSPAGGASASVISQAIQQVSINQLEFSDFEINTDLNSMNISWQTSDPTLAKFSWGEVDPTSSVVEESIFARNHNIKISNLSAGTLYNFIIETKTPSGGLVLKDGNFETVSLFDITPPANIGNLKFTVEYNEVILSWINPIDSDFDFIKIIRSEVFFVNNPFEGKIVYEGRNPSFIDKNLETGKYYYTVFAFDRSGNYSSGSLVSVKLEGKEIQVITPEDIEEDKKPISIIEDLIDISELEPTTTPMILEELSLDNFSFYQDGKVIPGIVTPLRRLNKIDGDKSLTISFEDDMVYSTKFDSVIMVLTDTKEKDESFPFFLSFDNEKAEYQTTITPLEKSGEYEFDIVFVDDGYIVRKLQGDFFIEVEVVETVFEKVGDFTKNIFKNTQDLIKKPIIFLEEVAKATHITVVNLAVYTSENIIVKAITIIKAWWFKVSL
ncbi:DUF5011 domain-containing protein [Patescibacteria group bacterium]